MAGTFNVVDYGSKTNHAIPHTEIDLDLLVAGVSLPVMLPPVRARGTLWTDAVWIKDANLLEAARRGAEEIWLVWCIGNTNVYRRGLLNQYVHMIELSANGSVAEELERIEEGPDPPSLHVVKPEFPIPLDPDFFFGRIDARALTAMGYRDARRYLERALGGGRGPRLDRDEDARSRPRRRLRRALARRGSLARRARRDPGRGRLDVGRGGGLDLGACANGRAR